MYKVTELPKNRQTDQLLSEKKESSGISIPKSILFDLRLSPKAKGLLCIILARPKDSSISVEGLSKTSLKIGKRSIQSGVKELTENGYLKLVPIYDKKGKFKGRKYQVVDAAVLGQTPAHFGKVLKPLFPAQNTDHFGKVLKEESPKTAFSSDSAPNSLKVNGRSGFRTFLKQESPKTASIISVVDQLNFNLKQQQQIKENPKMAFSIEDFFPLLLEDEVWKAVFVGQLLSNQTVLSSPQLDLLLHHFKQTSLRSSATYPNLAAVKKHFSNWYNLNLSQKSLITYIKQQHLTHQNTRKRVFDLVKHSENIFRKLKKQLFSSENQVLRSVAALQKHQIIYRSCLPYLQSEMDKAAVKMMLADIEKTIEKVGRAKEQGKLGWFCG